MCSLGMRIPFPNKPAPNRYRTGAPRSSSAAAAAGLRSISLQCSSQTTTTATTARRSGNYKPPLWDFNYIQSLTSQYTEERYSRRAAELIVQVKMLLLQLQEKEGVPPLELIDDLQRLGISYHFGHEINQILNSVYVHFISYHQQETDLYSTALAFRLLRDHGFPVSQGVFDCFKNKKRGFRSNDTRGVLQLYEASFLLTEGEESLELAKEFATDFLQRKLDEGDDEIDENLLASIRLALELPIHWRIQRPNARWFIEAYGSRRPQMNPIVLELAKLDFNILQAIHQQELTFLSMWWKETRLAEALPFARDRVVENYFWTLGGLFQPKYGYSRMMATKVNVLITIIDDIFDVYGTWEELQLFNTVIQRWDVEAMDQLPDYMQMCFLTLNNLVNEMAYDVLKEQGILIIKHLRKSWIDLFTAYTQEAKWYAMEYTPTLDEYMSNAWISVSAPVILTHAFFLITNPIQNDVVQSLYKYHDLVRYSAMLLRLANDLGTSPYEMERGDVPKSVQCYMKERGGSRDEAREHIKFMIWETWKKMNETRVGDSPFSQEFIRSAVDLGRMAQYMYQFGDGHGIQNSQIKDQISSLLFEPILFSL